MGAVFNLGIQSYCFRKFLPISELVDALEQAGLSYVEIWPRHLHWTLDGAEKAGALSVLRDKGIALSAYGAVDFANDEAQARKVFDFARTMGIETVVSEPPLEAMDLLEKLCDEYEINLAIHNHPRPSIYWDYRTVLAVCKGRSRRIGACCDTGHWMRSGIQPLVALGALEGRIISFHLKDLKEFGKRRTHDVPWGTGRGKIREILLEMHRQKFRGVFAIEYERSTPSLLPNIAHCAGYFDAVAAGLLATK